MHPYKNLPEKHFWRPAVAERSMFDVRDLWDPKFPVGKKDRVATFGSCFAQHIGRALAVRGLSWLDGEPAPKMLSPENKKKFNYGIFSCRTGNIYTTSLLKQWLEWSLLDQPSPKEIWEKDGRFFDPFRPNIEPNGFISEEELQSSREVTISAMRNVVTDASLFIFTLGLTESWINNESPGHDARHEYALCPGTLAGSYDKERHKFVNQTYRDVYENLEKSIQMLRNKNANLRILLTVSPVPLTATASGNHIVAATMYSKSVLRAVAGDIINNCDFVDYFPSYEIFNSPVYRGAFFEPNQRSVNPAGVSLAMKNFFQCMEGKFGDIVSDDNTRPASVLTETQSADDVVCEEELLEAFGSAK